jgi:hypothetical protein
MHRGGREDARASCASPLGTPLTGYTVSNVGIFYSSCELVYRGMSGYVFVQCVTGGGGIGGLRQINTCRQVPSLVNF